MGKIALDSADFEKIISENKIYVDKTKFLFKIIADNTYYFLSRPRRFGKSLFLDTLHTFFEGKKELFQGLYIYDKDWEWEEYPIIKLDFNEIENYNPEILYQRVDEEIENIGDDYNINLERNTAPSKFNELVKKLSKKYKKGVVVLVDEYDKPIISHLGKKRLNIAKDNQEFLKRFFDNLKSLESYLKTVFITGVSKFTKVSIFSTLNNLIEIEKEPLFAEILGYTEEELNYYFGEFFIKLAEEYEISVAEAKNKFKRTYNGFRFTEKDSKVYNPYSTGRALNYLRFDNYWFESGTPTFLVDLIKEKGFNVTDMEKKEIGRDEIKAFDLKKLELIPLLFQTGYLTIKDVEDEIIYTLGYPNYEVEQGFSLNLIKSFSEDKITTPIIHRIKKSLINKDYKQFIDYIKSLFANIANINIPKSLEDREHFYNSIFYLTGVLFSDNNLDVYTEILTADGRIDMVVETEQNIFIIEFKCNQSAEKALNQIEEKNYSEKYIIKEKEIVLIGINFDTDKRNVEDYLVSPE
jgi:hypothetical protein